MPKYPIPCEFCEEPAGYIGAQSEDGGQHIVWRVICRAHANGWNEGGDWLAPIYALTVQNRDLGPTLGLGKEEHMRTGSIPSSWLGIADTWSAEKLLRLRAEVDRRGIAEHDLDAVRALWRELQAKEDR